MHQGSKADGQPADLGDPQTKWQEGFDGQRSPGGQGSDPWQVEPFGRDPSAEVIGHTGDIAHGGTVLPGFTLEFA